MISFINNINIKPKKKVMEKEMNSIRPANQRIMIVLLVIAIVIITITSCNNYRTASTGPVYSEVDEMPVFPNGDQGILNFIAENTLYPEEAKLKSITGRVLVKFIVETDGSVSGVAIEKSVDPILDAEAVRVVSSLPKFEKPGIKAGKKVRVNYILPITFALK